MYASLYNSNHIKEKGGNLQNRENYDKVYKEFMKSKRADNPKELLQSQRNCNFIQNAILNSNSKTVIRGDQFRSDSKRKWKSKKKTHSKDSARMHFSKNKKAKKNFDSSRSKERTLESKIDFYHKSNLSEKEVLMKHKTYDDQDKENQGYNQENIPSYRFQNDK